MDCTLVRVDNRLVHGQILEAWLPYIKASCIIVVDDEVATDFFRETVIKMAVPRQIELFVYGVEEFTRVSASNEMNGTENAGKKAIVLFSTLESALRSYQLGFQFPRLNIGNLYNDQYKLRCAPSILLSDQDITDIEALIRMGVIVECRCVPKDKPIDAGEFINNQ